ncbi:hypothetical protein [Natrinema altunense]|uniref:Uncharacterized protein n=1 Tax=Natrinema altunense TaxID=222984 RepID=A0A482Y1Y5_9EURY|nr:hypothetical protein [Natrinema altunense]RZH68890.1 hypothetical protein ELS17_05385 [Natrinema altunense]
MSTDPTAAAVLEEVEADPDAILAAFDADSPADLVDAGGDHDPRPEDAVDTTASDLFADLAAGETAAANATAADSDGTGRDTDADDRVDPPAAPDAGSTDGIASSRTLTIRDGRAERLALVGPEPTRTRIADGVFGGVRVDTH